MGGRWNTLSAFAMTCLYMFGPLAAALWVLKRGRNRGALRATLAVSFQWNRWFAVAWFLPFTLAGLMLCVSVLMPGVEFSGGMDSLSGRIARALPGSDISSIKGYLFWFSLLYAFFAGPTVNALLAFGEEAGWRGFLQNEWGGRGFWKCSLMTGLVWGLWHAPLILMGHNYPQHPVPGVFMMGGVCVLLSPVFSFVRIKSGSVVAAAIVHGTFNATAGLALMFVKGGSDLTVGATGLAGIIALVVLNLIIFLFDRFVSREPAMG